MRLITRKGAKESHGSITWRNLLYKSLIINGMFNIQTVCRVYKLFVKCTSNVGTMYK